MAQVADLKIYNVEDRLTVAQILIKNGYTVGQRKRAKTATGKTQEYFLRVEENPENVETLK